MSRKMVRKMGRKALVGRTNKGVWMPTYLLEQIDFMRNSASRSAWIRAAIKEALKHVDEWPVLIFPKETDRTPITVILDKETKDGCVDVAKNGGIGTERTTGRMRASTAILRAIVWQLDKMKERGKEVILSERYKD